MAFIPEGFSLLKTEGLGAVNAQNKHGNPATLRPRRAPKIFIEAQKRFIANGNRGKFPNLNEKGEGFELLQMAT